jgi:26S proteasome regulatory subunit N2
MLQGVNHDQAACALQHLPRIVAQFWAESVTNSPYCEQSVFIFMRPLADSNSEAMAKPTSGEVPSEIRPFAALLTSKTYFYIGVLSEAVEFALKVGAALRPSLRGSIGGRSSVSTRA